MKAKPKFRKNSVGLTSVELISVMIFLIIGGSVIVGISNGVQKDYKTNQTRELQKTVSCLLVEYYNKNCAWPTTNQTDSLSSSELLGILKSDDSTRNMISNIPASFLEQDSSGAIHIIDAFGNRLAYRYSPNNKRITPELISKGHDVAIKSDDITFKIRLDSRMLAR